MSATQQGVESRQAQRSSEMQAIVAGSILARADEFGGSGLDVQEMVKSVGGDGSPKGPEEGAAADPAGAGDGEHAAGAGDAGAQDENAGADGSGQQDGAADGQQADSGDQAGAAGEGAAGHAEGEHGAGEPMVRIKVDGREIEVPESQIRDAGIRTFQKDAAADRRLAEATRLLQFARAVGQNNEQPAGGAGPAAGGDQIPADVRVLARAIRDGSEEDAANALAKVLQAQGRGDAIPAQAVQQMVRQEMEASSAFQQFRKDYPEIANNRHLLGIAVQLEDERLALGDSRPLADAWAEHGKRIRTEVLGVKTPQAPGAGTPNLQERRERKAAATPPINAAAARRPAPTQQKEPSPADIVERMRRARHQA